MSLCRCYIAIALGLISTSEKQTDYSWDFQARSAILIVIQITLCIDHDLPLSLLFLAFRKDDFNPLKIPIVLYQIFKSIFFKILISKLSIFPQKFILRVRQQFFRLMFIFHQMKAIKLNLFQQFTTFLILIFRQPFKRYSNFSISELQTIYLKFLFACLVSYSSSQLIKSFSFCFCYTSRDLRSSCISVSKRRIQGLSFYCLIADMKLTISQKFRSSFYSLSSFINQLRFFAENQQSTQSVISREIFRLQSGHQKIGIINDIHITLLFYVFLLVLGIFLNVFSIFGIDVLLYLNMQERIRIQAHLEKLREECVKDYLSSNLESIASREVINDVLKSFLETNNKQFLESIADSILQVKQNNKSLRDALQQMEMDYQRLLNECSTNKSIEIQKMHSKQIGLLQQKLVQLKDQFKVQMQNSHKQIQSLRMKILVEQNEKQQLKRNLQQIRQALKEKSEQLNNKQQYIRKKDTILKNHEQNSKNEMQNLQKMLKTLYLQKLQQQTKSKQILMKENTKKNEQFSKKVENEKLTLISINQQLKNQIKDSKKQQQNMKQLWQSIFRKYQQSQKQKQKLSNTIQTLKEQIVQYRIQSANISNLSKQSRKRQQQLLNQISLLSNSMKEQRQLFEKRLEEILDQNRNLRIFNQQIVLASKKNDQTLDQQAKEIQTLMKDHSRTLHALQMQKIQSLQTQKIFKNQIQKLKTSLKISEQQAKSLLNYNSLQQRQISRLQQQCLKIKQQSSAQMQLYQSTFQLNIKSLQQQLSLQKQKSQRYSVMIGKLQQQIEGQKQKQKYYHGYMQQIAVLKKKLQINQLNKNKILYRPDQEGRIEKINKKTKIFTMLQQVSDKYKRLDNQHEKLKRFISQQLCQYKSYFSQLSHLLCNQIHLSLNSSYLSDHISSKSTLCSPHNQTYLNKTLTKKGVSLKQQLKSVQQRYQTINIQNRTFTSNISSLLNS